MSATRCSQSQMMHGSGHPRGSQRWAVPRSPSCRLPLWSPCGVDDLVRRSLGVFCRHTHPFCHSPEALELHHPSSCEPTLSDSSLDTSSWSFLVHSSVESHGQLTSFSTITEKKSFGNLIGLLKCFRSFLSLLSDTAQQGSKQPCFHCLSGSPQRWITAGASRSASTGTGS